MKTLTDHGSQKQYHYVTCMHLN